MTALQRKFKIDTDVMDGILSSHRIPADKLRADDFQGYFEARGNALLERIENAMGKPVSREQDVFQVKALAETKSGGNVTGIVGREGLTGTHTPPFPPGGPA